MMKTFESAVISFTIFRNSSVPAWSSDPSSTSSMMSRLVVTELRSFDTARQVNISARSIRSFSPSLKEAYENSSRKRERIFSLKFSSSWKSTKNSIAARYLLISLFMIGTYCLMIRVLIPPSFNIEPTINSRCQFSSQISSNSSKRFKSN